MKILLVDDFADTRELYAEYLGECGYTVEEAADGRQALDKAFATQPDVIIMDLSLPAVSGWDVIRQLKGDSRTAHIPVVAVSGHQRSGPLAGEGDGVAWDAYLTKPCLPEDLLEQIRLLAPASAAADGR
ncbi:MAG TPA: response regulator [Vicinamibacterales bacterium]